MRRTRPQDEACDRVVRALVGAEAGDAEAWRLLDLGALERLRDEGPHLATLVPHAMIRLTEQLAVHPRAGVRFDLVGILRTLFVCGIDEAGRQLARLAQDTSPRVHRAARQVLGELGIETAGAVRAAALSASSV